MHWVMRHVNLDLTNSFWPVLDTEVYHYQFKLHKTGFERSYQAWLIALVWSNVILFAR